MLIVTRAALERLSQKLARKKSADDMTLRFKRADGRWRLHLDRARPDDASYSRRGREVLVLDEAVSKAMAGMKLDVTQTDAGPRLKLRRTRKRDR